LAQGQVDTYRLRLHQQAYVMLFVERRWPQRNPVVRRLAGQVILRQIRAVARWENIGADHRDRTAETLAAQCVGRGQPCCTATHDDDAPGMPRGPVSNEGNDRARRSQFLSHEDSVSVALDPPTSDG